MTGMGRQMHISCYYLIYLRNSYRENGLPTERKREKSHLIRLINLFQIVQTVLLVRSLFSQYYDMLHAPTNSIRTKRSQ